MPKCRALTRGRSVVDVLSSAVVWVLTRAGEDDRAGTGGASQNQSTSSATTGTPQRINVAVQASLPQNWTMIGTVIPAATASPIINPSLNSAATRPICAGNQRRARMGIAVWASAMPRLMSRVKRKSQGAVGQRARRSAPPPSRARPMDTQALSPMRSASSPASHAPQANTSTGKAVSNPVSV